jgi:hypothetical protein
VCSRLWLLELAWVGEWGGVWEWRFKLLYYFVLCQHNLDLCTARAGAALHGVTFLIFPFRVCFPFFMY